MRVEHPGGAAGHGDEVLPVDARTGLHGGDLRVADRGVPVRHRGGSHPLGRVDHRAPEVVALEEHGDAAGCELLEGGVAPGRLLLEDRVPEYISYSDIFRSDTIYFRFNACSLYIVE